MTPRSRTVDEGENREQGYFWSELSGTAFHHLFQPVEYYSAN